MNNATKNRKEPRNRVGSRELVSHRTPMNNTPKTDALLAPFRQYGEVPTALIDFARELERENTRLREALEIIASGDDDARRRAEDALG